MITVSLRGHLKLADQLRLLAMPSRERRRVHGWLAGDLQRTMRRAVRATVETSPLEHFDGDEKVRAGRRAALRG